MDRVKRAAEAVKAALESEEPDPATLKSCVAGLDLSLLDLGKAIHLGSRKGAAAGAGAQNTQDGEPIELRQSGPVQQSTRRKGSE